MSSQADLPHFDLPFRFAYRSGKPSVVVVDQDTNDDVFNCVVAIVRTYEGFRPEMPDFGLPEQVFMVELLDTDALGADVVAEEGRARVVMDTLQRAAERRDLRDASRRQRGQ